MRRRLTLTVQIDVDPGDAPWLHRWLQAHMEAGMDHHYAPDYRNPTVRLEPAWNVAIPNQALHVTDAPVTQADPCVEVDNCADCPLAGACDEAPDMPRLRALLTNPTVFDR